MKRKQIYIDEESELRLKSIAFRRRQSEASLIREAVLRFLSEEERPVPERTENPLLEMIGMIPEGRDDAALHHDRYLYREDS